MDSEGRTFALEFEDDEAIVVSYKVISKERNIVIKEELTGCEEIKIRMGHQGPEPIVFPPERLYSHPLRQIPNPDCLILSAAHNQLVFWMENSARDVIKMPPARIHFPSLRLTHSPDLDRPIISRGDDKW